MVKAESKNHEKSIRKIIILSTILAALFTILGQGI